MNSMPKLNQKGLFSLIPVIILLAGIGLAVFLTLRHQNLKSDARVIDNQDILSQVFKITDSSNNELAN